MKHLSLGTLFLALAGCGQAGSDQSSNTGAAASAAATYSGRGIVKAVTGHDVTIAHGPIGGIGWPAMTMTFRAERSMANGIKPGDKVAFAFRQAGQGHALTSISHAN